MSSTHTYDAEARTTLGSHAAKKGRSAGLVPVTISKRGAPSKHVTIKTDQAKHLAANVVHLCKVKVGKDEITALKGEIAVHCLEDYIQHIDLMEVDPKGEIVVDVAIHLKADNCPGVKAGGIVEQSLRTVKVRCPVNAIPDAIEFSLDNVQVMETVYTKSLVMPKGVSLVTKPGISFVSVVIPRWMKKAEEETTAAAAEGAEGAAPAAAAGDAKAGDAKAADPKAAGAKADPKAAAKPDAKAPAKK